MFIRKGQLPILLFNLIAIIVFAIRFLVLDNYEFIIYIGVIIFFLIVFAATNSRIYYPNLLLWGLTLWAFMHMAGGGIFVKDGRLYDLILIPLSAKYPILRYDQVVHIIGFGVATMVMFYMLKPILRPGLDKFTALSIVIIFAGLGVGALNEIVECLTAVIVPQSGVGGYMNTSLDLIADLIGAVLAMAIIRLTAIGPKH
ncbi:MAG: DUF2238 domain-containing protein [Sedimentisphaerales bacterium]|nr:DUF2238 domain-containing protein [Sedimentisphaerales bacterium]